MHKLCITLGFKHTVYVNILYCIRICTACVSFAGKTGSLGKEFMQSIIFSIVDLCSIVGLSSFLHWNNISDSYELIIIYATV